MYVINVSWLGGPPWDNNTPSMFNPNKKKSPTEHLLETGGQSIDDAIKMFDRFKESPIRVTQYKPDDNSEINWVTQLWIESEDVNLVETTKDQLLEVYNEKKQQLIDTNNDYRIEISVDTIS